jgi:hypothetical protein
MSIERNDNVDNHKWPKYIMDSTIIFISLRRLESTFGSSNLEPGQRKRCSAGGGEVDLARPSLVCSQTGQAGFPKFIGLHHCVPLVELIEKHIWIVSFGVQMK